jgi:hypothetical protein
MTHFARPEANLVVPHNDSTTSINDLRLTLISGAIGGRSPAIGRGRFVIRIEDWLAGRGLGVILAGIGSPGTASFPSFRGR